MFERRRLSFKHIQNQQKLVRCLLSTINDQKPQQKSKLSNNWDRFIMTENPSHMQTNRFADNRSPHADIIQVGFEWLFPALVSAWHDDVFSGLTNSLRDIHTFQIHTCKASHPYVSTCGSWNCCSVWTCSCTFHTYIRGCDRLGWCLCALWPCEEQLCSIERPYNCTLGNYMAFPRCESPCVLRVDTAGV